MGTVTPPETRLTIAVLTFRRPDDLAVVLPALIDQARQVADLVSARVLVVDNDPQASARAAVEAVGDSVDDVAVVYVSETTPGIAAGRNRALDESSGADFLVFIDDDERPSASWLRELVRLQGERGAEAVVGPVVSEFAATPDPWITAGDFFVRRRLATGTAVEVAATNNLLLDLAFVRRHGLAFDRDLGAFGGEDTLFTRQIVARGGAILWCAEAQVTDVVPLKRLTRRWVTQRAFSSGNGWSLTSLLLTRAPAGRVRLRLTLTAQGAVRVAGGIARVARGVVTRSLRDRAKGVRTIARGAGMVSGAWGYAYQEYRRP
ncbi:glycosyltransferase family 2 protein [Frondihabitans sucicola]|uniref:glycosyltransferase family 2 protein n=1 Tax=Frondihabitans sucicola TaxID=1268041 RepID=UPI002573BFC3|nr:glycosyltransferase [Frondihabitans sucicola]